MLIRYCEEELRLPVGKLQIKTLSPQTISGFIDWLKEKEETVSPPQTKGLPLCTLFQVFAKQEPQYLLQCQQILAVDLAKNTKPIIDFLSVEELQLIFSQISESSYRGRRDAALLHLLYDSAARVQELCDLRVRDVFLKDNPHVLLRGKGGKSRYVPIVTDVAHLLRSTL